MIQIIQVKEQLSIWHRGQRWGVRPCSWSLVTKTHRALGSGKLPGYPWGSRRGREMSSVATWRPELSVLSGFGDTEN